MASSQTQAQVPPDDNHWHNQEDVVITDQAVGLPDVGTFNLYKITSPLKQREEIRIQYCSPGLYEVHQCRLRLE